VVVEGLEERDLAVVIGIGRVGGERLDERPAEERRELSLAVRVAVMTTRPGPEIVSSNGWLALAVFTNTIRFAFSFASSVSKSCGVMSGPGRLNFAVRSA
jgi:hypothetical protein